MLRPPGAGAWRAGAGAWRRAGRDPRPSRGRAWRAARPPRWPIRRPTWSASHDWPGATGEAPW